MEELRPADRVGIVAYGNRGRVLLEPTDRGEKQAIMGAINSLVPSGLHLRRRRPAPAYKMAAEEVQPGRITRVLLLSDGVGNVGRTGAESILSQIRPQVDAGVSLTTIGFGMGNFNDVLMEQLANDGDGAYHYVDTLTEARRVFVENMGGRCRTSPRTPRCR